MRKTAAARAAAGVLLVVLGVSIRAVGRGQAATSPPSSSPTHPPVETGEFLKPDLVELVSLNPRIHLDIRYATANNLAGRPLYTEARAFLQRPVAIAVARAEGKLEPLGFGLVVFDGYRPWSVTKVFWDLTPPDKKEFVADPAHGSRHNRGCAVDLSLYDLATGQEADMPSAYDEMSPRAYPTYAGGTAAQRERRDLLRRTMEAEGFTVDSSEWWHFDHRDCARYAVLNVPFDQIGKPGR